MDIEADAVSYIEPRPARKVEIVPTVVELSPPVLQPRPLPVGA